MGAKRERGMGVGDAALVFYTERTVFRFRHVFVSPSLTIVEGGQGYYPLWRGLRPIWMEVSDTARLGSLTHVNDPFGWLRRGKVERPRLFESSPREMKPSTSAISGCYVPLPHRRTKMCNGRKSASTTSGTRDVTVIPANEKPAISSSHVGRERQIDNAEASDVQADPNKWSSCPNSAKWSQFGSFATWTTRMERRCSARPAFTASECRTANEPPCDTFARPFICVGSPQPTCVVGSTAYCL